MKTVGSVPELIHAVTHDIGEPVREIIGFARLIAEHAPRDVDAHFWTDLDHVTAGAERTRAMLEVLCDYIRAAQTAPGVAVVDLAELDAEIPRWIDRRDRPGVDLHTDLHGVTPVHADVLVSTLQECVVNAVRFGRSEDGIVHLGVRVALVDDVVEAVVSDAGPGIPEQSTERALQLFQRLHSRHELDTMGAGLALARSRVDACGGTLTLHDVDPGLAVIVRLPVPPIDLRRPVGEPERPNRIHEGETR